MENNNFNLEQDWVQGTQYQSESYKRDSWNGNYALRDNEANPRRLLLAFIASIATFFLFAMISVFVYDIDYVSTINACASVIPSLCMVGAFYRINSRINKPEMVMLFFLNCILIYLMFHAIMARAVQRSFPEIELSFWECCKFVNTMRHTESLKEIYYTHFFQIMGYNLLECILTWLIGKCKG